jgi:hypothetical protein
MIVMIMLEDGNNSVMVIIVGNLAGDGHQKTAGLGMM